MILHSQSMIGLLMLSRNILFQQTMQYSRGCLDVFSRVFSFFVSRLQLNAYFCKNYSCRKPDTGKSKGGIHIHKRRNCTLWFWRPRTSQLQMTSQKQSNGDALWGAYTFCSEHFLQPYVVRRCSGMLIYTSSWGFRRCSFRLVGQCEGLRTWSEWQTGSTLFVYVRILNFTKPFTVVATTTLLDLENE